MISDYSREPRNGKKPEYLVVFMHGYGSSGALMSQYVGDLLGPLLPEAKLRFPDAPVQMGWDHHSWFELRDVIDNDNLDVIRKAVKDRAPAVAKDLNAYITRVAAEDGIPEDRIIIAGFSQGGTMAFYTGLSRETPVAGVFSISGGALDWIPKINSQPSVKLVAGELEQQEYSGAPHAQKVQAFLVQKGVPAEVSIIAGQKHETSPASMEMLRDFARTLTAPALQTEVSELKAAVKELTARVRELEGPAAKLDKPVLRQPKHPSPPSAP